MSGSCRYWATCSRRDGRLSGLCASGILIRAVAPLLASKQAEPPVVALAEDGSVAVPLLGGHRGANALARALAGAFGGIAAITTAGDLRLGFALDEPPPGWRIANPDRIKPVAAALLAGEPVMLVEEAARADWLRAGTVSWSRTVQPARILASERPSRRGRRCDALVFHPPVLALGIGCERGVAAEEVAALAHDTLAEAGLAAGAVAAIVSIDSRPTSRPSMLSRMRSASRRGSFRRRGCSPKPNG